MPATRASRSWRPSVPSRAPRSPPGRRAYTGDGHVAELFGWTRAETEALLPLLEQDPRTAYHFTSSELWARLFLGGESAGALAERLLALPKDPARRG
jgi:hypothetical protein